jgi:hypothetical protein
MVQAKQPALTLTHSAHQDTPLHLQDKASHLPAHGTALLSICYEVSMMIDPVAGRPLRVSLSMDVLAVTRL